MTFHDLGYIVSPTSKLFPATGSEGTVPLMTANDCGWIAAASVNWITFETNNGAGTSAIPFSVRDNLTSSPRTGIIRVGGQTFTVVQDSSAAADCGYTVAPSFQSFPAAGGSGSFNLFTEERCAWETSAGDAWITITSGTTGIGNGTVTFTVGAHTSGKGRRSTITVGSQVFTVKQKG